MDSKESWQPCVCLHNSADGGLLKIIKDQGEGGREQQNIVVNNKHTTDWPGEPGGPILTFILDNTESQQVIVSRWLTVKLAELRSQLGGNKEIQVV